MKSSISCYSSEKTLRHRFPAYLLTAAAGQTDVVSSYELPNIEDGIYGRIHQDGERKRAKIATGVFPIFLYLIMPSLKCSFRHSGSYGN